MQEEDSIYPARSAMIDMIEVVTLAEQATCQPRYEGQHCRDWYASQACCQCGEWGNPAQAQLNTKCHLPEDTEEDDSLNHMFTELPNV